MKTHEHTRKADDLLRKANHALIEENKRLRLALGEAWETGADHRKPTFEQLNQWREILATTGETE